MCDGEKLSFEHSIFTHLYPISMKHRYFNIEAKLNNLIDQNRMKSVSLNNFETKKKPLKI